MQQIITFQGLYSAYRECRRHKRHTANAQRYEMALLDNLFETLSSLHNRNYSPTRSIRFIAQKPKAREIHAADFSDRVVHHWLVPKLEALFEPVFIHDLYSNRKGKGTHKAVDRLQSFMHSITFSLSHSVYERKYPTPSERHVGWVEERNPAARGEQTPALAGLRCANPAYGERNTLQGCGPIKLPQTGWYLQLDIANFFNTIDKPILFILLQQRLRKAIKQQKITSKEADTLRWLCHTLLKHDATTHAHYRGDPALLNTVPAYKQLGYKGVTKGLPIGNLTSQFFANVYLNPLDQMIKHQLKCRHYLRYVDDFILLADSPITLYRWREAIQQFLKQELQLQLKEISEPKPVKSGVDFLGYITYPHYRLVRRRVVGSLYGKLQHFQRQLLRGSVRQGYVIQLKLSVVAKLRATLASYWGHFSHANSFSLRQRIVRQFPWLTVLFEVDSLYKIRRELVNALQPCWEPKATQLTGYKSQVMFFKKRYPLATLRVQRGTEQDQFLHVGWVEARNPAAAGALLPALAGFRCANPAYPVPTFQPRRHPQKNELLNFKPCVTQLHIREQGYYKGGLKRRHIFRIHIQPGTELCPT